METIASAILTGVLVLLTGYYAWQTHRTVEEMRRARGAAIVPHVVLSFDHPGGAVGFPVVSNVGLGPAADVEVSMNYEPNGPKLPWYQSVIAPGERHRFLGPDRMTAMPKFIESYEIVALVGTCKDALGETHEIDSSVELAPYWEASKAAVHLVDVNPLDKLASELEKVRNALEQLQR